MRAIVTKYSPDPMKFKSRRPARGFLSTISESNLETVLRFLSSNQEEIQEISPWPQNREKFQKNNWEKIILVVAVLVTLSTKYYYFVLFFHALG